jgi:hypothetical protein
MHATTIPPTIAAERKGYKVRADVLQVFILYFTFSPYHLRPFPPEVGVSIRCHSPAGQILPLFLNIYGL